ncbi:MAG TPA: cupin domain-containing protein [Acidimicrobiales bacterium]|nr:cupin domain-containing protein [Acidimicrobiales bacterium]
MTRPGPSDLARLLGLKTLEVEGGRFSRTYQSGLRLAEGRPAATAIYALFTADDPVSRLHRLDGDEIWHFYLGDPMDLVLLRPDGTHATVRLGPDVLAGEVVQQVVPAATWMGARLAAGGSYALIGATMTPGFVSAGFEPGDRHQLRRRYPAAAGLITSLTPDRPLPGLPSER